MAVSDSLAVGALSRRHPIVYFVFATILIVSFLKLGADLLIPLVFGTLISLTLSPAIDRIERYRVPYSIAVFAVLIVATAIAAALLWFLTVQIASLVSSSDNYGEHFVEKVDQFLQFTSDILSRLGVGTRYTSWERLRGWWRTVGHENFLSVLLSFFYGLRVPLTHFFGVYLLTFLLLLDRKRIRDRIYALLGRKRLFSAAVSIADSTDKIQKYLLAQGGINATCALASGIVCHIHGVPQPYLWGLLIGICRYVPFVGFWFASAVPIALCLVVNDGWSVVLSASACFVAIEIVFANFIEPLYIGRSVGLNTLGVICATVFWGWVWGIPGVILGVPLTITLSTLAISIPQLQFLPMLVGAQVQGDAELHFLHRVLVGDDIAVAQQLRDGFDVLGPKETLVTVALPSLVEIHRLGLTPTDKLNTNVKKSLHTIISQTEILRSSGGTLVNLKPSSIFVLSRDHKDSGLLGSTLCSLFTIMGAQAATASASALVSEIAELCRTDGSLTPAMIVPIITDEDATVGYRFLKRFVALQPLPALIIVYLDKGLSVISDGLLNVIADDRIRVVHSWDRLLECCHEIAIGNRLVGTDKTT